MPKVSKSELKLRRGRRTDIFRNMWSYFGGNTKMPPYFHAKSFINCANTDVAKTFVKYYVHTFQTFLHPREQQQTPIIKRRMFSSHAALDGAVPCTSLCQQQPTDTVFFRASKHSCGPPQKTSHAHTHTNIIAHTLHKRTTYTYTHKLKIHDNRAESSENRPPKKRTNSTPK